MSDDIKLPELPEPEGWIFQHEDTGRMTTLENDGINNPENFRANNPRFDVCDTIYAAIQLEEYARAAVELNRAASNAYPKEIISDSLPRYFSSGPDGSFYTNDLVLARKLCDLIDRDGDDWTIFDQVGQEIRYLTKSDSKWPASQPPTPEHGEG